MNHLEIRLLGPFEVLARGRPANVSGGKRQGLLALLALRRGRVVAVDALVGALWGDDLPAAPRNAVRTTSPGSGCARPWRRSSPRMTATP